MDFNVTSTGGDFTVERLHPDSRFVRLKYKPKEGHFIEKLKIDNVNHPPHYNTDPSGVECITITRHRNFNIGNAIKYLWRQGLKEEQGKEKKEKQIEDLKKAIWYIEDEIQRISKL